MSRRIPSFILALSLLLRPNPCASEPAAVSSLRPVNSQEVELVLDLLTAGLEENKGAAEGTLRRMLPLLRGGVGKRTPEVITTGVAKAMGRTGPKAAYWRRSLQLRLEQRIRGGSFRPGETLSRKMAPLLQGPLVDPKAIERALNQLRDEEFGEKVPFSDYAGELLVEQETGWVLRVLWNSHRVFVHGSFVHGFLRPDSDVDILFWIEGQGYPAGHWMWMEIPLKGERQPRAAFRVLHPDQAKAFLKSSGLLLTPDRVLIREGSGWRLNGESLAALFRTNHEIRDRIRSAAEAVAQPLSETEIARQAIIIQQGQVSAASAGPSTRPPGSLRTGLEERFQRTLELEGAV